MKKEDAKTIRECLTEFNENIVPWGKQNNMTLHQAFVESRNTDDKKYRILCYLWGTKAGKAYLKSYMKKNGGKFSK